MSLFDMEHDNVDRMISIKIVSARRNGRMLYKSEELRGSSPLLLQMRAPKIYIILLLANWNIAVFSYYPCTSYIGAFCGPSGLNTQIKCCDGIASGNYVLCASMGGTASYGKWVQRSCLTIQATMWCAQGSAGVEDYCYAGLPVLSVLIDLANISRLVNYSTAVE